MSETEFPASQVDQLLCSILRKEVVRWPAPGDPNFADQFLDCAVRHGVAALVYGIIEDTGDWGGCPDRVQAGLLEASRAAAALELLRQHAFADVVAAFGKRGIQVLVIKGGALATMLYGHPRLRTRCDTDLFIHFRDIERVRAMMAELGLETIPPFYKSHQFVCARKREAVSVNFDIHWRILNAPQFARVISFEEAWDRSMDLPGVTGARTLNPVDALLLACLHRRGSELHDADRLIWLYDIHLLASSLAAESWTEFTDRVVEKRVAEPCLDGLQTARDCLSTEVPAHVIRALEQSHRAKGKYASSNLALLIDDVRCLPGWKSKLGLLRELFFPPPRLLLERYQKSSPAWLPVLYVRQLFTGAAKRLSLQ